MVLLLLEILELKNSEMLSILDTLKELVLNNKHKINSRKIEVSLNRKYQCNKFQQMFQMPDMFLHWKIQHTKREMMVIKTGDQNKLMNLRLLKEFPLTTETNWMKKRDLLVESIKIKLKWNTNHQELNNLWKLEYLITEKETLM